MLRAAMAVRRPRKKLPTKRPARRIRRLFVLLLLGFAGWIAFEYVRLPHPDALVKKTPPQSALMRTRVRDAERAGKPLALHHRIVPLSRIAPVAQRAVVLSEDARFWQHEGIDWLEVVEVLEKARRTGEVTRGASTITQQLARNLYLTQDRSVVRKAKEWVLARRLEKTLTKRRILELYLNFAEWGDGVFGIEAAAQVHFGTSAARLDAAQAAALAAMLPAPRQWNPARPTPRYRTRAHRIADLLVKHANADAASTRARLTAIVGPK